VSLFPRIQAFFHPGMMLSVVSSRPATRLSFPSHTLVQDDDAQCFPRPEPLSFPAPAQKYLSVVRCFSSRVICHHVARWRSPLSSSRNWILHLKADCGVFSQYRVSRIEEPCSLSIQWPKPLLIRMPLIALSAHQPRVC